MTKPLHVAIVGSRDFPALEMVKAYVLTLPKHAIVVSGGARGVDRTAERMAMISGLETRVFFPDWEKYGKQAGFIRNHDIIDRADIVAAFWDGDSRGTANSIELAKKKKKPLTVFKPDGSFEFFPGEE